MGNTSSAIPATINRKTLLDSTKSTRNIVDNILQYILTQTQLTDFNKMSNPIECSKYVLTLANSLNRLFIEMKLYPDRKDGTIIFRKIDDLRKIPDEKKLEHQSLCLILSYFYTRILQIYGALALTLMDDAATMSTIGYTGTQSLLDIPGQDPYMVTHTIGGVDLGPFVILRPYLTLRTTSHGIRLSSTSSFVLYFQQKTTIGTMPGIAYVSAQASIVMEVSIAGSDIKYYPEIIMDARFVPQQGSDDKIRMSFNKVKVGEKEFDIPASIKADYIFILNVSSDSYSTPPPLEKRPIDIIIEIITKLKPSIIASLKRQIPESLISDNVTISTGQSFQVGVQPAFDIHKTYTALSKIKPLPHCVSRGLQLLSNQPIGDNTFKSNICNTKFYDPTSGKNRSGVPAPGEKLDTSPSISALNLLFYDTISQGTIKIGEDHTIHQYTQFMRTLMTMFGDSGKSSIPNIINKRDIRECRLQGKDIRESVFVSSKYAKNINDSVKRLFTLQIEHAYKAGEILNELFLIQKDPTNIGSVLNIRIHPNIFKLGIPEIERINRKTRELLIKYFTVCESTYLQGFAQVKKGIMI